MIPSLRKYLFPRIPSHHRSSRFYTQSGPNDKVPSIEQLRLKGIQCASKKNYQDAEKYFLKILDIDQNNTSAMSLLGELYDRGLNKPEKATLWLRRSISAGSKDPNTFIRLGNLLLRKDFKEHDMQSAIKCFENALEFEDRNDLYFVIGMTSYEIENFDKAITYLEKARKNDPIEERRKAATILLAEYYSKKRIRDVNSLDIAIDLYKEAMESDDSIEIKIALSRCLIKRELYDEAHQVIKEVLKQDPTNLEMLASLAEVLFKVKRIEESLVVVKNILAQNPKHVYAQYVSGMIYFSRNLYSKAIGSFETALKNNNIEANEGIGIKEEPLDDHYINIIHKNLGTCYFKTGKLKNAKESLLEVLKADDSDADAHLLLGETYENLNENENALKHYRMASVLDPYLLKASFLAGIMYANLEQFEQAIVYFEKVISNYNEAKRLGIDIRSKNEKEMLSRAHHNISGCYQRLAHYDPSKAQEHQSKAKIYFDLAKQYK